MRPVSDITDAETDIMSNRASAWPRIYERKYPSGRVVYVVDCGMQHGKRVREVFNTKGEAESFAQQLRLGRHKHGAAIFLLPFDAQSDAVKLYEILKPHRIGFHDVIEHYSKDVIPYLHVPNVAEITEKLAAAIESKGCRPCWRKKLKNFLREFSHTFGERRITDIKEEELQEFCYRSNHQPKTKRNRRAMASQLFNFAIKKRWTAHNLTEGMDVPQLGDNEPEYLMVDQVRHLLLTADQFDMMGYLILAVFAGIRPEELQRLDWTDVHSADGIILIEKAASKIHERREVPINPTLAAWLPLCGHRFGPIVERRNFPARFKAWREAAGINEWTQDVLRHTFATFHAAEFHDENETARQMGHIGGLRTLRRHYVAFVPQTVAKEFWALRPETVLGRTTQLAA